MTTTRLKGTDCPRCEEFLDGFTSIEAGNIPKDGDISICAYCLTLLRYESDLSLRVLTDEEIEEFKPQIKAAFGSFMKRSLLQ